MADSYRVIAARKQSLEQGCLHIVVFCLREIYIHVHVTRPEHVSSLPVHRCLANSESDRSDI
jgi:hypothetical protein